MKEIKNIELVFENCESLKIESQHIGTFHLEKIERSFIRKAINYIAESLTAKEFNIEICRDANNIEYYTSPWVTENSMLPFDRIIKFNDITSVYLKFEDDTEEGFYVDWDWSKDDEYNNTFQTSKISEKTGDLYIVVSEKNKVEDVFKDNLTLEKNHMWRSYC